MTDHTEISRLDLYQSGSQFSVRFTNKLILKFNTLLNVFDFCFCPKNR